jgi:hypothetical protein
MRANFAWLLLSYFISHTLATLSVRLPFVLNGLDPTPLVMVFFAFQRSLLQASVFALWCAFGYQSTFHAPPGVYSLSLLFPLFLLYFIIRPLGRSYIVFAVATGIFVLIQQFMIVFLLQIVFSKHFPYLWLCERWLMQVVIHSLLALVVYQPMCFFERFFQRQPTRDLSWH